MTAPDFYQLAMAELVKWARRANHLALRIRAGTGAGTHGETVADVVGFRDETMRTVRRIRIARAARLAVQ